MVKCFFSAKISTNQRYKKTGKETINKNMQELSSSDEVITPKCEYIIPIKLMNEIANELSKAEVDVKFMNMFHELTEIMYAREEEKKTRIALNGISERELLELAPACIISHKYIICPDCNAYKMEHYLDIHMAEEIKNQDYCKTQCDFCASARQVIRERLLRGKINNKAVQYLPVDHLDENVNTKDKYFSVKLTSERSDGSDDHLFPQLRENFNKLCPDSFEARAAVCAFSYNDDDAPTLYGLIRYNSESKYRINEKTPHIKNTIKIQPAKGKRPKPRQARNYTFKCITDCTNQKHRFTRVAAVMQAYNLILDEACCDETGPALGGDPLESFLRPA
jgi:hypothetical protein